MRQHLVMTCDHTADSTVLFAVALQRPLCALSASLAMQVN